MLIEIFSLASQSRHEVVGAFPQNRLGGCGAERLDGANRQGRRDLCKGSAQETGVRPGSTRGDNWLALEARQDAIGQQRCSRGERRRRGVLGGMGNASRAGTNGSLSASPISMPTDSYLSSTPHGRCFAW